MLKEIVSALVKDEVRRLTRVQMVVRRNSSTKLMVDLRVHGDSPWTRALSYNTWSNVKFKLMILMKNQSFAPITSIEKWTMGLKLVGAGAPSLSSEEEFPYQLYLNSYKWIKLTS